MTIPDPERGSRQLVWAIACGTLVLLALELSEYFRTGQFSAIGLIGRPFVFVALGFFAFEGREWAPKVAGVWIGILALVAAGNGIPALSTHPFSAIILFAVALGYLLLGFRLIASPHIRAFVVERAARRTHRGTVA